VPVRLRKLIGTALMVILVIVWALFFMALAQGRVQDAGAFWHFVYYVVAGMGWIVPAGILIRWMQKP
jgi:hypothetical protein